MYIHTIVHIYAILSVTNANRDYYNRYRCTVTISTHYILVNGQFINTLQITIITIWKFLITNKCNFF